MLHPWPSLYKHGDIRCLWLYSIPQMAWLGLQLLLTKDSHNRWELCICDDSELGRRREGKTEVVHCGLHSIEASLVPVRWLLPLPLSSVH